MVQENRSFKDLIYDTERQYRWHVERLERDPAIAEANKKLFLDFVQSGLAEGLSKHRIIIYLRWLWVLGRMTPVVFDRTMTRKDLEKVIASLRSARNYSDWSWETIKACLKKYFRWVYGLPTYDPAPEVVRWLRRSDPPSKIRKEDLLTPEEVEKLISSASNLMYRALISVGFWGALRPGELLTMRVGDVKFSETEVMLSVQGKMERRYAPREIPIYEPYNYLRAWYENHPFKGEPDSPLWVSTQRRDIRRYPISGRAFHMMIWNLAKRAGISKRTYPYILRHSRGRLLYLELGEALAKKYMGHSPDSKMARFYSHLVDEDVLDRMREHRGIRQPGSQDIRANCSRCQHPNGFGAGVCSRCGMALGTGHGLQQLAQREEASEHVGVMKRFLDFLEAHPTIQAVLREEGLVRTFAQKEVDRRRSPGLTARQEKLNAVVGDHPSESIPF